MNDGLRIFCCIDGCRRSWRNDGKFGEIICSRHYKMASPLLRNRFKRVKAAIRATERKKVPDARRVRRLRFLLDQIWRRIQAAASGTRKPAGLEAELDAIGVR